MSQAKTKRLKALDVVLATMPDEMYTLDVCVSFLKNGKGGLRQVMRVLEQWEPFTQGLERFADRTYFRESDVGLFQLFLKHGWDTLYTRAARMRLRHERANNVNSVVDAIFGPFMRSLAALGPLKRARAHYIDTGTTDMLRLLYEQTRRTRELANILEEYDMLSTKHRDDPMCREYIARGIGDVETIVESIFWNTYTLYPILARRYTKLALRKAQQDILDAFGSVDAEQYTQLLESYFHKDKALLRAKKEAISNYRLSGMSMVHAPKQVLTYDYTST